MDLLGLLIVLIVIGAILYLVETLLPIAPEIKVVIRVVVVVAVLLYLLRFFFGSVAFWGPHSVR